MSEAFEPPVTDGSGRNRQQLRQALQLFKAAGWTLENGKLMKDGRPVSGPAGRFRLRYRYRSAKLFPAPRPGDAVVLRFGRCRHTRFG